MAAARKRYVDGDVERAIMELAAEGWGAAQIRRELARRAELQGRLPILRTIQRMVAGLDSRKTQPWSFGDGEIDDAQAVLAVLAARNDGQRHRPSSHRVTLDHSVWIGRLARVAGDLPPVALGRLSFLYSARATLTDDYAFALDLFIAFTPWRTREHWARYLAALDQDMPRPLFLRGADEEALRLECEEFFFHSMLDLRSVDQNRRFWSTNVPAGNWPKRPWFFAPDDRVFDRSNGGVDGE